MLALNNVLALAVFRWNGKGSWLCSRSGKALVAMGAWKSRHLGFWSPMIPAGGTCAKRKQPSSGHIGRRAGRQAGMWLSLVGGSLILR